MRPPTQACIPQRGTHALAGASRGPIRHRTTVAAYRPRRIADRATAQRLILARARVRPPAARPARNGRGLGAGPLPTPATIAADASRREPRRALSPRVPPRVRGRGRVAAGRWVVPVALAFAVLDLTGSATDLGIVLATGTLALVCSLLFGGVVADRAGRRTVMIAADVIRMLGQTAIGVLLITGQANVAGLGASQAILGAATGFFNPASSGLMPAVAGEHLQQANALAGWRWRPGTYSAQHSVGCSWSPSGQGRAC